MSRSLGEGLEGRTAVITGAAGGIGRAVVTAFADAGARVAAVDRDRSTLEALVARLPGGPHRAIAADLADIGGHDALLEAAATLGDIYAFVALAAVLRRRPSLDAISEADWDEQLDVNLKATFFLCRAAGRAMAAAGHGGRIVTISSQGWWTGGFGGSVVYATSKGGIVTMTRGLARALGPDGITVNCVAPGNVRTPMLMDGLDPAIYERMREQTPLGEVAEPEDIAGPILFLASDHARHVTGATINVSGGFLMY
ncbi:MAG TPA: SDR family NAD(P)-dependent oxidoreductase [Patescibacteria group bacterium]|nr:SDR family NAD(P)-dependent oxidoreductase [Patescibacteria group bacterium]